MVDFTRDGQPWLGILKLNYKNGYTHYTESVDGAPVNSIIQQRACLPTQSGKVEEGALVDLTDYSMKLLEKKFDIDGHKEFYLSTVVFQYTTAQPEKKDCRPFRTPPFRPCRRTIRMSPMWRHRWPCSLPIRPLTTTTR